MSVNNSNPTLLFGGEWERIKDRFLLSAGSTYAAGTTGGEATHKLTVAEMPKHSHKIQYLKNPNGGSYGGVVSSNDVHWWGDYTDKTGGDEAHNNMPPYLAVYVWKRTS